MLLLLFQCLSIGVQEDNTELMFIVLMDGCCCSKINCVKMRGKNKVRSLLDSLSIMGPNEVCKLNNKSLICHFARQFTYLKANDEFIWRMS